MQQYIGYQMDNNLQNSVITWKGLLWLGKRDHPFMINIPE